MSNISINDLSPRESSFELCGNTYHLKKFALAAQVWAHDEFATEDEKNGLTVLSQALIELEPSILLKMCYYLLKDKKDFPTLEVFINAFEDHHTVLAVLLKPFSECLGVSQPDEATEDEVELKKSRAAIAI